MENISRIVAVGDSFTLGVGTSQAFEDSQLGGHPKWKEWPDDVKDARRNYINYFRRDNSFSKFLAEKISEEIGTGVIYDNLGESGSSNTTIIDKIVNFKWHPSDLAIVGFSSSLRDPLPIIPKAVTKSVHSGHLSWSFHEFLNSKAPYTHFDDNTKGLQDFWVHFVKNYYAKTDLIKYTQEYNKILIYFTQQFFEYHNINYIMFDAFENMIPKSNLPSYIDDTFYWKIGEETCFSYCRSRGDTYLEPDNTAPYTNEVDDQAPVDINEAPRHPSRKGHVAFAEELFKFIKKISKKLPIQNEKKSLI